MGLLTDPSAGQGKLTKALVKYHAKITLVLYIVGVIWFCLLASSSLNLATHFSENALLPGLVQSEFVDDSVAKQFFFELQEEMKNYDDSIPYPWLSAKFRQIGLDTHTHNFTLNYPLGKSQKTFTGKNVYGILRAARASSTESLIMSVPYRPPANINPTTAPSIAIMLAFAQFANKEKYWSKDIIFLITEHEQLGAQAWLEAYHSVSCGQKGVLDHGDLHGRAGAIQAAINLELHDINIDKINVKVEGLNGQLPNLDLFNLVTRMCTKEGILHTFKGRKNRNFKDPIKDWMYSSKTLLAMVFSQATGIPNGNHGLFHRFGIQALTMEGFSVRKTNSHSDNFFKVGRILEGIFRSLNNLLERFHQSYFFYLLPSSSRFVSISLYMPAVCLIAGTLFIKACGKWCHLQQNSLADGPVNENEKENTNTTQGGEKPNHKELLNINSDVTSSTENSISLVQIGAIIILTHIAGIAIKNSPRNITKLVAEYDYSTETAIFGGFIFLSVGLLASPIFVTIRSCYKTMMVLNILALLELATVLICLSMYNYSLGLLVATLYTPIVLIIGVTRCRICSIIQRCMWMMVHPLVVLIAVTMISTFILFPGETWNENIVRGFSATKQAIVYGVVDSMIYNNWLYGVVTCIMVPNWLCFWITLFYKQKIDVVTSEKKKNV